VSAEGAWYVSTYESSREYPVAKRKIVDAVADAVVDAEIAIVRTGRRCGP